MLPFFLQVDNLYAVDSLYLSATKRLMLFTMWVLWSVVCCIYNLRYLCHPLLGSVAEGSTKKLQVNMANIRKKLGIRPGDNRYIINELGVGYRMQEENEM